MKLFLLKFYVPECHLEIVKTALFEAGAGSIGNYKNCTWQVEGTGQFTPLEGSDPYIGEHHRLEKVIEYKVEMVCSEDKVKAAIAALKKSHPYEAMVYYLTPVEAWVSRESAT